MARVCEESGADAITIHGRTREQRYSRAADWDLIGRVAAERGVPVIGNGDILTHYEARERMARSGVRSVMLARGALIKPWLFREIREGRTLAAHGRGALRRALALRGAAARALRRRTSAASEAHDALPALAPQLLLPLPAAAGGALRGAGARAPAAAVAARGHRRPPRRSSVSSPTPRPETHQRLAEELLASASRDEALDRALVLAAALPADGGGAELRVSASEVAG